LILEIALREEGVRRKLSAFEKVSRLGWNIQLFMLSTLPPFCRNSPSLWNEPGQSAGHLTESASSKIPEIAVFVSGSPQLVCFHDPEHGTLS
jgi:hypothetical protein